MKGLLRKELSGLWSLYRKTLPMISVLYAVLYVTTKQDFFLYFGVWMMLFYSLSSMSLDESCGCGRYARTLPVWCWEWPSASSAGRANMLTSSADCWRCWWCLW